MVILRKNKITLNFSIYLYSCWELEICIINFDILENLKMDLLLIYNLYNMNGLMP